MKGWITHAGRTETGARFDPSAGYIICEAAPHSQQVAANDIFFLHDRDHLVAVARIADVITDKIRRKVPRCPVCGIAQMNTRAKQSLAYRCLYNHEFAAPVDMDCEEAVRTARFGRDYIPVSASINASDLRPFEITNSQALSLRPCNLDGLAQYIARRDFKAGKALTSWMADGTHALTDSDADDRPAIDTLGCKGKVQLGIRIRRGDSLFRDRLLKRYGERCMISGCAVLALIEAAYIQPQPGLKSNNPTNGVLLRSDLHTLFDVNLIGIDPDDHTVVIHPKLLETDYARFAGAPLGFSDGKRPNQRALTARWRTFVAGLPGAAGDFTRLAWPQPAQGVPDLLKPHEAESAPPRRWQPATVGT